MMKYTDEQRHLALLKANVERDHPNPTPQMKAWLDDYVLRKHKEYCEGQEAIRHLVASKIDSYLREAREHDAPIPEAIQEFINSR